MSVNHSKKGICKDSLYFKYLNTNSEDRKLADQLLNIESSPEISLPVKRKEKQLNQFLVSNIKCAYIKDRKLFIRLYSDNKLVRIHCTIKYFMNQILLVCPEDHFSDGKSCKINIEIFEKCLDERKFTREELGKILKFYINEDIQVNVSDLAKCINRYQMSQRKNII